MDYGRGTLRQWKRTLAALPFRIAIKNQRWRLGLPRDCNGIRHLLAEADIYESSTTRRILLRSLDPNRWVHPAATDILTVKDMSHHVHVLTEADLFRHFLGERLSGVDQITFNRTGTHLFVGTTEIACALSPKIITDGPEYEKIKRLQLISIVLSQLTELNVDHEYLGDANTIVYKKIGTSTWRRSNA